jgi:predicted dehydrogenase
MPGIRLVRTPPLPKTSQPIVIIGAGGIVPDAHLPAYTKVNFPVVGIFDLDQDRAHSLAERFKVSHVFTSVEAAAAEAPPNAVFDLAVLIQKPLGGNLEQARRIVDVCHHKNLHAAVNFQLRYAPYVLAARSLIEQGAIGELHDIEIRVTVYTPWHTWTFLQASPRLEILYHSIHYLDLVRFFFGEPRSIYAKTLKHPKLPQVASTRSDIILDYCDTVRACVFANHGHEFGLRHQESHIKWEGTRGAIVAKMGLLLNYPQGEPDKFEYCTLQDSRLPKWRAARLKGSWFPDGFIGTLASVMRYMEGSAKDLSPSVDDACKTMALVETAHGSSDGGGSPFVEFPG